MDDEVGVIAGGAFGEIVLRKDSDKELELGQLLVYEKGDKKLIWPQRVYQNGGKR